MNWHSFRPKSKHLHPPLILAMEVRSSLVSPRSHLPYIGRARVPVKKSGTRTRACHTMPCTHRISICPHTRDVGTMISARRDGARATPRGRAPRASAHQLRLGPVRIDPQAAVTPPLCPGGPPGRSNDYDFEYRIEKLRPYVYGTIKSP
eukprot:SAG31_NODE_23_length_33717_cov_17.863585_19_plen_149_part_00